MKKVLLYSLFFILITSSVKAGDELKNTRLNAIQLVNPGAIIVNDDKYPAVEVAGQSKVAKSQGRIILSVDPNSKAYVAD